MRCSPRHRWRRARTPSPPRSPARRRQGRAAPPSSSRFSQPPCRQPAEPLPLPATIPISLARMAGIPLRCPPTNHPDQRGADGDERQPVGAGARSFPVAATPRRRRRLREAEPRAVSTAGSVTATACRSPNRRSLGAGRAGGVGGSGRARLTRGGRHRRGGGAGRLAGGGGAGRGDGGRGGARRRRCRRCCRRRRGRRHRVVVVVDVVIAGIVGLVAVVAVSPPSWRRSSGASHDRLRCW